jgi:hypothetical protein
VTSPIPLRPSRAAAGRGPKRKRPRPRAGGREPRRSVAALKDRSTLRVGGRASWRPTSPWTPRTSCCASSSASAPSEQTAGAAKWIRSPARRRHLGQLLRRPAGSLDHHRGLRGAPAGRRPVPTPPTCAAPRPTSVGPGDRGQQGLHPDLAGPLRQVAVGRASRHAPRAHAAPAVDPPQHLRLRLLGPPDGGGPHRDQRPPARARALRRHRRAGPGPASGPGLHSPRGRDGSTFSTGSCTPTSGGRCAPAPVLAGRGRALDRPARRPTARGAASSRPGCTRSWRCTCRATRSDHPVMQAGLAGLDGSPSKTSRAADRGLPVAGVGHRPGGRRPGRRRRAPDDPRCARPGAGWSERRSRSRGTGPSGGPTWPRAAGPSSSPTTTTPTSTTRPRWCWPCAGPSVPDDGAVGRAVAWTEGMQCRDGGWGAFDVDNTRALPRAALLRLRRAHRPAERGRHRPRRRDAVDPRPRRRGHRARGGLAARRPGGRRVVVRPLGGQPPLRDRRRRPGPGRGRHRPATRRAPGRGVARIASERRRRLGRGPALLRRPGYRGRGTPMPVRPRGPSWPCWRRASAARRPSAASDFLVDTQRADGTWDETWFTGTGFPGTSTSTTTSTTWSSR